MSDARRAIEALRAGVPNRAAIRLLGTPEDAIRERFMANLQACHKAPSELISHLETMSERAPS